MNRIEKMIFHKLGFLDIDSEEAKIVQYGLRQCLKSILGLSLAIILGIFMHITDRVVVFFLGYIPLRIYAGGYHSKSEYGCAISSALILFVAFLFLKSNIADVHTMLILEIIECLIIGIIAPVENLNHKLSEQEKKVFGTRTFIISTIITASSFIFAMIGLHGYVESMTAALSVTTALLVAGKATTNTIQDYKE